MNRFVTLLALAIGVSGSASAGIINPYGNPELNTNVVAGQVSASGVIERGVGFSVQVVETGTYRIKFDRRYFPSGCAALVVSPMTLPTGQLVAEDHCKRRFVVRFYAPDYKLVANEFQFIAREDAPQH
jgi:hypothetical protein